MRALVFALVLAAAATPLHAQQQRDRGGNGAKGAFKPSPERRMPEGPRADPRRPERMSPADRERLRRDIDEANRRMEPPRRR